jgi:IS5 family transposase
VLDGLDAASATGGRRGLPARSVLSGPSGIISLQIGMFVVDVGVRVLTLSAAGAEQLWDELLPLEVKELPQDLAALDELLGDPALLAPIAARWEQSARERGRPSLAIETYVRLMVIKHRCGWGYETLVREVSDSLHLRRFCRIALDTRVPDESTVRKLTRRLGADVVAEITRALIAKATREKRFRARAVRIDSTVIEADIQYPTDADLASHGVRRLAREGRNSPPRSVPSGPRCAIARARSGTRCA